MKVTDNEDRWLDQLLEQPAVLDDYGFTNAVNARIKREEKLRKQIFVGAGVVWLIILLVAFPAQFVAKVTQQSLAISASVKGQAQSLLELEPAALMAQSGSVALLVILLLGVFALISLQFSSY